MNKKIKTIIGVVILALIIAFVLSIKPYKHKKALKFNAAGSELYLSEQYSEAKIQFEKAISLNDELIEAYNNLSKTLLALNDNDGAFATAELVLQKDAENIEALTTSGQVKVKNELFEEAIDYFNKVIALDNSFATAYYYRGVAYANLGNLDASLEDYKKAQELDQKNLEYYQSSLTVRTKLEDYSGIIGDYNKIIELDPSNTEAFYMRGYYKLNIDDYEGAIEDFDNALKLEKKLGKAYYYKGLAFVRQNNFKDAAPCFNQAAINGFKPDEAYFNEGLAWLQLNRPQKAKVALIASLEFDKNGSKSKDALLNLGVIELMAQNFQKAIEAYTDFLSETPDNTDALYNRAAAYSSLKMHNEAISDLNSCIQLGRKDGNVYYLRGLQFVSLSNFQSGCLDLREALELGHENAKQMIDTYCKNY